ncbi:MAG: hypothetical protein JWQ04_115, partial [Pedosphaera sp.]|nr:hypothetical protein [Pedosphaera sp.]
MKLLRAIQGEARVGDLQELRGFIVNLDVAGPTARAPLAAPGAGALPNCYCGVLGKSAGLRARGGSETRGLLRAAFMPSNNPQSVIRNPQSSAFTLIELMMVVAIMVIAMALSYPAISDMVHRAPMAQAVKDVMEKCRYARAQAILTGKTMEFRIYPQDLRIEVAEAPADTVPGSTPPVNSDAAPATGGYVPKDPSDSSHTAQISGEVTLEMVDVNFTSYKEADVARVRFYP